MPRNSFILLVFCSSSTQGFLYIQVCEHRGQHWAKLCVFKWVRNTAATIVLLICFIILKIALILIN